jgi:ABC-type sugar transport system ATPase subunit
MVFQNYALYPHMTRLRQHGLRAALRKAPKAEIKPARRARRRASSLTPLLERKPRSSPAASASASRWAAHRARPEGVPVRRAAVQPRRQAARADARRDQEAAPALCDHLVYVTHDQVEAMTLADRSW